MRKLVFTLAIILVSFGVFAQNKRELKSPAFKNYKPWLNKNLPTLVYNVSSEVKLKSPASKNYKPWRDNSEKKHMPITYGSNRSKLMGPAYKNYKPWRKTQ